MTGDLEAKFTKKRNRGDSTLFMFHLSVDSSDQASAPHSKLHCMTLWQISMALFAHKSCSVKRVKSCYLSMKANQNPDSCSCYEMGTLIHSNHWYPALDWQDHQDLVPHGRVQAAMDDALALLYDVVSLRVLLNNAPKTWHVSLRAYHNSHPCST